jgi:tRNA-2-methylthio-N6-dimethylallyladenosine synthase
MNIADAERVSAVLSRAGYKETKNEKEADIIVVVMCSIRQSAVDRIHWLAQKFNPTLPRKAGLRGASKPITILTGCILTKDKKVFVKGFDYIIDIRNIAQLPEIIKNNASSKISDRVICTMPKYLDIRPKNFSKFSASVPIMTGCNNFCAYCVVPYTREREVSRPAEKIIAEVKKLIKTGYKEIWLLGQNVNSYKSQNITFAKLLKMINKIPGDFWIRFTSSHPKDFNDDIILAMAEQKHITPYLNLPVQSGDDRVLKLMNRHYAIKEYKEKIKKLRKKIPNIAISTDVIVGFPGETKKQFENTAKLFLEIKYDMAYINKFSPRPGTAAAKLKDDVSWQEKKRREKVLTDILRQTSFQNNKKLIGKTVQVLIDSEKDGLFLGKTNTYKSILIRNENLKIGRFYSAKIIKARNWNLEGQII